MWVHISLWSVGGSSRPSIEENEDSTKWRTMTAVRLEVLNNAPGHEVRDSLIAFRLDILETIGYKVEEEEKQNRLAVVLNDSH